MPVSIVSYREIKDETNSSCWKGSKDESEGSISPIVDEVDPFKHYGRVKRVVGLMIESQGPESSVGDVCYIYTGIQKKKKKDSS